MERWTSRSERARNDDGGARETVVPRGSLPEPAEPRSVSRTLTSYFPRNEARGHSPEMTERCRGPEESSKSSKIDVMWSNALSAILLR